MLRDLKDHVSSFTFEGVLKTSFGQYTQHPPEIFCFCSTPECGFIYRCVTAQEAMLPGYVCTSCHAQHEDYKYAENKDLVSSKPKALTNLKKELNIKDCPEYSTPIENVDGCNHMT